MVPMVQFLDIFLGEAFRDLSYFLAEVDQLLRFCGITS